MWYAPLQQCAAPRGVKHGTHTPFSGPKSPLSPPPAEIFSNAIVIRENLQERSLPGTCLRVGGCRARAQPAQHTGTVVHRRWHASAAVVSACAKQGGHRVYRSRRLCTAALRYYFCGTKRWRRQRWRHRCGRPARRRRLACCGGGRQRREAGVQRLQVGQPCHLRHRRRHPRRYHCRPRWCRHRQRQRPAARASRLLPRPHAPPIRPPPLPPLPNRRPLQASPSLRPRLWWA